MTEFNHNCCTQPHFYRGFDDAKGAKTPNIYIWASFDFLRALPGVSVWAASSKGDSPLQSDLSGNGKCTFSGNKYVFGAYTAPIIQG